MPPAREFLPPTECPAAPGRVRAAPPRPLPLLDRPAPLLRLPLVPPQITPRQRPRQVINGHARLGQQRPCPHLPLRRSHRGVGDAVQLREQEARNLIVNHRISDRIPPPYRPRQYTAFFLRPPLPPVYLRPQEFPPLTTTDTALAR